MGCINAYIDKDVESLDLCDIHWYEAAMRIVYQNITPKGSSSIVVYATCSIRHIAHDERLGSRAELCKDVGDSGSEEQQAFWKL